MIESFNVEKYKNGVRLGVYYTNDNGALYVFENMSKLKKAIKEIVDSWNKEETPRNDDSVPF